MQDSLQSLQDASLSIKTKLESLEGECTKNTVNSTTVKSLSDQVSSCKDYLRYFMFCYEFYMNANFQFAEVNATNKQIVERVSKLEHSYDGLRNSTDALKTIVFEMRNDRQKQSTAAPAHELPGTCPLVTGKF